MLFMFVPEEAALWKGCLISWRTPNLCKRVEALLWRYCRRHESPSAMIVQCKHLSGACTLNSWTSFSSSFSVTSTPPPHSCHLTYVGQWLVFFAVSFWLRQRKKTGFSIGSPSRDFWAANKTSSICLNCRKLGMGRQKKIKQTDNQKRQTKLKMKLGTARPVGWYHACFPALQQVICPRGCSRERLIFKKVDESKLRGLSCS